MSTPHPPRYSAELIAELRAIDRATWPSVDRVLARLGLTREQVLADGFVVANAHDSASAPTPIADTNPTKKEAA